MITEAQASRYFDQGYVVLEDVVPPAQLSELRRATDLLVEQSRDVSENNEVFELEEGHSRDRPRLTRIKLPHLRHPAFHELLFGERITAILKRLLGPDVRLNTSKLNFKASGGGAAVEWHQDWAFYPHTNDDLLAVGVLLEDVDERNGPLMVIPGSHKGPVLDHTAGGVFCGAINPDDPLFAFDKAVTLTGRAGSVTIHHVRTLHGSAPNWSDRSRMVLFYECVAADAWPIFGALGSPSGTTQAERWQDLRSRMICGEQPRTARLAAVPVIMPLPPPPDVTSIFRMQKAGGAMSAFAARERA